MKLWFHLEDGQTVLKECRLDRVVGRLCTTRVGMGNDDMKVSAGTRMQIRGYDHHRGWMLTLPAPCKCCGLTGRITGIRWTEVTIDGPVPRPPTKAAIEAARALGGDEAVNQLVRKWERENRWYEDD